MAITRVNAVSASSVSGVFSLVSPTFSSTTGNSLVVFIRYSGTGTTPITSVVNAASVSLTQKAIGTAQDPSMAVYVLENITGNASEAITVNLSAGTSFIWMYVLEYSGLTSTPTDVARTDNGSGVTDLVSSAFSTGQASEVVIVAVSQSANPAYTAGADFTLIDGAVGSPIGGGLEEYITSGVLTSYIAHITSEGTNDYSLSTLSFKGVGGPPPDILMGQCSL